jgi:predicted O-methyltransferase YrrM
LPVKFPSASPAERAIRSLTRRPLYGKASMLRRLPRLAARGDPTSKALVRALRTTALGRIPAEEREWIGRIEARRRELAADETAVPPGFQVSPPRGAAAAVTTIEEPVAIRGISALFSIPAAWGVLQMRLVRELAPKSCLELGAGVGLSAAYQAAALELNGAGTLTTLEGAHAWGAVAEQGLAALGLAGRGEVRLGAIDDTVPEVAQRIAPIEYAFLDADHSEQATCEHFDAILPHLAPGAVVLLDDITLSRGMRRAWKTVRRRERVSASLDLGRMGVVAVS